MTCHKLSNVISFYMLMIHVLFVNINEIENINDINEIEDIHEIEKQLNIDFSNICD